jgi:hypothetical protein
MNVQQRVVAMAYGMDRLRRLDAAAGRLVRRDLGPHGRIPARVTTVTVQGRVILDLRAWRRAYIVVGALMVAASFGLLPMQSWSVCLRSSLPA